MTRRRLAAFTLQAFLFLIVFLLLYPIVLPVYEPVVLAPTNAVLERASPASGIETDAAGNRVAYLLADGGSRRPLFSIKGRSRLLLYSNLVILPALLLATPIAWRKRLALLAWSLPLLVVLHVAAEVAWVHAFLCLKADPGDPVCRTVSVNAEIGGPLLGIVQWALLCWRYWMPKSETARQAEARA